MRFLIKFSDIFEIRAFLLEGDANVTIYSSNLSCGALKVQA
jgi:hypothetical protein